MGWDDAAPTAGDLQASSAGWDATPPTESELKGPQWADLPNNIIPDAKNVAVGALGTGLRMGKGLYDLPGDILHSGEQVASGAPMGDTPLAQDARTTGSALVSAAKGIRASVMDLGSKDAWVNHPVQNAVNAGGLLAGGLEGGLSSEAGTGVASRLGEVLEKSGAREATGVAGITPKTITKMTPRGGNEAVTRAELGKRLVDDDVIGGFGETPEKIRDNQLLQKAKAGNQVKGILGQIRDSGVPTEIPAKTALSPILDEWSKLADGALPESRAMSRTLASVYTKLENVANKKGGNLGFDDIHDVMDEVGAQIQKTPKDSPRLGDLNHLYSTLATSRDAIVQDVAERTGDKTLSGQLHDANNSFHLYSQIGKDVGRSAAKEGVEKPSNIGFYGSLWAMAHGEFDKAAEFFVGGRLLGPALKEVAPSMAKNTVQAGRMMQKYGPVLENAAKKGARSLAVTSAVIANKDPEYAETLSALGGAGLEK